MWLLRVGLGSCWDAASEEQDIGKLSKLGFLQRVCEWKAGGINE